MFTQFKPNKLTALIALACAPGMASAASSIDLAGIGWAQYGDGLSYSMPLAQYATTGDYTPGPGDEFYIDSTSGQIAALPVIGIGVNGGPSTTNVAGMDDAYYLPSGTIQNPGPTFFESAQGDPSQADPFTNDFANTWDATLASLSGFLGNNDLVFFFQNNQQGRTQAENSLAAWAQLWITDGAGNVVKSSGAGETGYFEFTNHMSPYALITEGGGGVLYGDPTNFQSSGRTNPGGNAATNETDYVLSGGEICLDSLGQSVSCNSSDAVVGPIEHNLGQNNAAYAVVFPELNALMNSLIANPLLDLTQYTMHLDVRLGCDPSLFGTDATAEICTGEIPSGDGWGKNLNNGPEALFIGQLAREDQNIPEPGTLALLGLGLAGVGRFRFRREK